MGNGPRSAGGGAPAQVLCVDDEPADVDLTLIAMRQAGLHANAHVVNDGASALAFLRREAPYEDAPRPDLILLDLNLPGLDGRDVLAEVKADARLRSIPVAILTTSQLEADVVRSYDLGANCYLSKPLRMKGWIELMRAVDAFWFSTVTLPPR